MGNSRESSDYAKHIDGIRFLLHKKYASLHCNLETIELCCHPVAIIWHCKARNRKKNPDVILGMQKRLLTAPPPPHTFFQCLNLCQGLVEKEKPAQGTLGFCCPTLSSALALPSTNSFCSWSSDRRLTKMPALRFWICGHSKNSNT